MTEAAEIVSAILDSEDLDYKAYAEDHGLGRRIVSTYSTITWRDDGSEDYDEEHGFVGDEDGDDMEPDEFEEADGITAVDKAIKFLKYEGIASMSSSSFHPGVWYIGHSTQSMVTGADYTPSYHLKGFSPEEETQIGDAMSQWMRR